MLIETRYDLPRRKPHTAAELRLEQPTPDTPYKLARRSVLDQFEKNYVRSLMMRHRGNLSAASREAGVSRRHLRTLMDKYRLSRRLGTSPVEHEERLTPDQQVLERVYLGLRTVEGLPRGALAALRPPQSVPSAWQHEGWVVVDGDVVRCTPEGWLRLDALVGALTRAASTP